MGASGLVFCTDRPDLGHSGERSGLLKMLSAQAGAMSASHAEAIVAKQCFDGDRRSLPNPKPPYLVSASGELKRI